MVTKQFVGTFESNKHLCDAASMLRAWRGTIAALTAFAAATPSLASASDVAQIVSSSCVACHGTDGKGTMPMVPNLAGQQRDYLKKQLEDFIAGRRTNELMSPNVVALKPADVDALATYFSSKEIGSTNTPPAPGIADVSQLIEVGKAFFRNGNPETGVPGCTACHMVGGGGDKRYPALTGQNSMYIAKQLADFKANVRTNDNYRLMRSAVQRMSEQEMKAVAEYLAVAGN